MYKLSKDHTAINRRDLLKQTGGIVAGSMLPTGLAPTENVAVTQSGAKPLSVIVTEALLRVIYPGADSYLPEDYEGLGPDYESDTSGGVIAHFKKYVPISAEIERQVQRLASQYESVLASYPNATVSQVQAAIEQSNSPGVLRLKQKSVADLQAHDQAQRAKMNQMMQQNKANRARLQQEREAKEFPDFIESGLASTSGFPRNRSEWQS